LASLRRVSKWLGIGLAILLAGCSLLIAGLSWIAYYMTQGVIETETQLQGSALVARSDDPAVRQALLSNCPSTQATPPASAAAFFAAGLLAEIPSGTKMNMPSWGDDPAVGTMTIAEGRLKGRKVRACRGQFFLLHPMP
jgi:hypothetical protein